MSANLTSLFSKIEELRRKGLISDATQNTPAINPSTLTRPNAQSTLVLNNKWNNGQPPSFMNWPADDVYPNETPESVIRRYNFKNTQPTRDSWRTGLMSPEERDAPNAAPSAQMPISAATRSPLDNDGYGAGYTRTPLDIGYQPPSGIIRPRTVGNYGIDVSSIPTTSSIQSDSTIINPSNIIPPQGSFSAIYNPNSAEENSRVQSTLSRDGWQNPPNVSAIAQPQSDLVRPQMMNAVPPNVSTVANTINPPTEFTRPTFTPPMVSSMAGDAPTSQPASMTSAPIDLTGLTINPKPMIQPPTVSPGGINISANGNPAPLPSAMVAPDVSRNRITDPYAHELSVNNALRTDPPQMRHGVKGHFINAGLGALRGLAHGGIGGAIGGAAVSGISPRIEARIERNQDVARSDENLARMDAQKLKQGQIDLQQANIQLARQRPEIQREQIKQRYDQMTMQERKAEADRVSREFNGLRSFDPADPANSELVERMRALNIPIVPKRVNQNIQVEHDEATNQWHVIETDPQSGNTQSRTVNEGGRPLTTTTPQGVSNAENHRHHLVTESHDAESIQLTRRAQDLAQGRYNQGRGDRTEARRAHEAFIIRQGMVKSLAQADQNESYAQAEDEAAQVAGINPTDVQKHKNAAAQARAAAASQRRAAQDAQLSLQRDYPDTLASPNEQPALQTQGNQPSGQSGSNYRGRTMSQASVERYARDNNISVDEARQKFEGMGVQIHQ